MARQFYQFYIYTGNSGGDNRRANVSIPMGIIVTLPENVVAGQVYPTIVQYGGVGGAGNTGGGSYKVHIPILPTYDMPLKLIFNNHPRAADWANHIVIHVQAGPTDNYYEYFLDFKIPVIETLAVLLGYIPPRTDATLNNGEWLSSSDSRFLPFTKNSPILGNLPIDRDKISITGTSLGGNAVDIITMGLRSFCSNFNVTIPDVPIASRSSFSAINGMAKYYYGIDQNNAYNYPTTYYSDAGYCGFIHAYNDDVVGVYDSDVHRDRIALAKQQHTNYKVSLNYYDRTSGDYHGRNGMWYNEVQSARYVALHNKDRKDMGLSSANATTPTPSPNVVYLKNYQGAFL